MRRLSYLALSLAACLAGAQDIPRPMPYDSRVAVVDYFDGNIVRLDLFYGRVVDLVLEQGEYLADPKKCEDGAIFGDQGAWDCRSVANHVFLKAKDKSAETNGFLLTNKRKYSLYLIPKWPASVDDMTGLFEVHWRYPAEQAAAKVAAQAAQDKKDLAKALQASKPRNYQYFYQGSEQLRPTEAYDDGDLTYFRFPKHKGLPSIWMVAPGGQETDVNYHADPKDPTLVVVHAIAEKFIIRYDDVVTCVLNKAFDGVKQDVAKEEKPASNQL
jgi:type IV secretion system protein VirB9